MQYIAVLEFLESPYPLKFESSFQYTQAPTQK